MLKLENISKIYLSKKKIATNALNEVNLSFPKTGMTFIVGKTGCGKSTLLNLLGKLDEPTSGNIYFNNQNITTYNNQKNNNYRNKIIGFIFQEYNLIDELSVYENIAIATKLQGKEVVENEIDELLEKFELTEQKHKLCDELSGGQKQRVAIIRAIVKKPKIILADEPTGAVDNKTGIEILEILKNLSKDILVIVVSHDIDYAKTFADRIIEISDGKIINDTSPNTKEEIVETLEDEKRGKLSFKDSFKLGIFNLKHRIKRLILMLIVSIVSFIILGVLGTFMHFNKNKMIVESMEAAGVNSIYITKYQATNESPISYDDLGEFAFKYQMFDKECYPVYKIYSLSISSYLANYVQQLHQNILYYQTRIYQEMEIDEERASKLGINLLAGTFPKEDNEIMISEYYYSVFEEYGYKYGDGTVRKIKKHSDLIGLEMIFSGAETFKIVGIIDTNFDTKRYETLKEAKLNYSHSLSSEFQNNLSMSLTGCLFHNIGFYDKYASNMRKQYVYDKGKLHAFMNILDSTDIDKRVFFIDSIAVTKYSDSEMYLKNNRGNRTLKANEIVINWKVLSDYYIENITLEEYVRNFVNEYKADELYEESEIYKKYQYANIPNRQLVINWAIENLALRNIFNQQLFNILSTVYVSNGEKDEEKGFNRELEIVGFINTNPNDSYNRFSAVVSDELFEEVVELTGIYDFNGFYTSFNDDRNIRFLDLLDESEKYSPQNHIVFKVNNVEKSLMKIAKILLIIGLILAGFSGLLFYTYINHIIGDKKKQIGVLRTLGANKTDILKVFLTESLILAGIISVMAIIGSFILSIVLNNFLMNDLDVLLKILSYGIISVGIIVVISFLIAIISTYLPINRISKLNPIESLKASK